MFEFVETMAFIDGEVPLLAFHQERVNKTFQKFFPTSVAVNLKEVVPNIYSHELQKLRMAYSEHSKVVTLAPYTPRKVESLRIVESNTIDYSYKSTNREQLNALFAQRTNCDDVLISRNGLVTDTSICNVAFFRNGRWFTPKDSLLRGVRQASLLASYEIELCHIKTQDIGIYEKISLFNALIPHKQIVLPISQIV